MQSYLMIVFGWMFIIAMLAAVIIPWVRRRSDLLTVWNLFLLGSANFIGVDSIATGWGRYHWGSFTTEQYTKFIAGALIFYICIFISYYVPKFPRRLGGRLFRVWPCWYGPPLTVLLITCAVFSMWALSLSRIQGFAQLGFQLGPPASVLAVVFVLTNWLHRPFNGPLAVLLVVVFSVAMILAVFGGTGRRSLMSLLMAIPICVYWIKLRYMRIGLTAWPMLISAVGLYVGLAAYSSVRYESIGTEGRYNPVTKAIGMAMMLPSAFDKVMSPLELLPSGTVEASLVCIDLFPNTYPTYPFQTIYFVVANPIPRAWWREKPAALGEWLGHTYGVWRRMGDLNISMGIVGHGYYEGGIHMLAFYGLLFGVFMRFADELLLRQCDNPFIIGPLAAASGNIVGLSRGEVSVFILLILAAYACALILGWIGRLFFGAGVVYPTDEQRAEMVRAEQMRQMALAGSGGYGYAAEHPNLGMHPSL